jgi:hypothetical protein
MQKKTFRRDKCAPKPRGTKSLKYTCYNPKDLVDLKQEWNQSHPTDLIDKNNPRGIWETLKEKNNECDRESCWLKDNKKLATRVFAPKMPRTWKKNIHEWLSSDEIEDVLNQYEKMYPEFEFIGPSPTDYFVKEYGDTCVWEELCKFNLKEWINKGKTKIGVVFNLDPHYKSGSHWVALFINTISRDIYYFDSTGARIHKYITRFRKEVQAQAVSQLGQKYEFDSNYGVEHQYHNTECGMYVLFFIITMLKYDKDYEDPKTPEIIGKKLKNAIKLKNVPKTQKNTTLRKNNAVARPKQKGGSNNLFDSVFKNEDIKFPDHLMVKLRNVYFND